MGSNVDGGALDDSQLLDFLPPGSRVFWLERMEMIMRVISSWPASCDEFEVKGAVCSKAVKLLRAERARIFMYTTDAEQIVAQDTAVALRTVVPLGQGLVGSAAAGGEVLCVTEAYDDPRFDAEYDH